MAGGGRARLPLRCADLPTRVADGCAALAWPGLPWPGLQEPVGYFLGGVNSILAALWFLSTNSNLSWSAMHQNFQTRWEVSAALRTRCCPVGGTTRPCRLLAASGCAEPQSLRFPRSTTAALRCAV
jgi:hypothetical protein